VGGGGVMEETFFFSGNRTSHNSLKLGGLPKNFYQLYKFNMSCGYFMCLSLNKER
jgi:hypothetical protein